MKRVLGKLGRVLLLTTLPCVLVGMDGCDEVLEILLLPLFPQQGGIQPGHEKRLPPSGQAGLEVRRLFVAVSFPGPGDSVAVLEDVPLIGMPRAESGRSFAATLTLDEKFLAIDGEPQLTGAVSADEPGAAVALTKDCAFVSAPLADVDGVAAGAVYVFGRPVIDRVPETQRLFDEFGAAAGDEFGRAVAAEGEQLLVGAPGVDARLRDAAGVVYAFVRYDQWYAGPKLLPVDPTAGAEFGAAVAMQGGTAVVGAPGASAVSEGGGAAYVFVSTSKETGWSRVTKLVPDEPKALARFGCAVDVHGDTIVVGAKAEDGGRGAAYVFVRDGETWTQRARVTFGTEPSAGDEFGAAVAVFDGRAAFGAPGLRATRPDSGVVETIVRAGDEWLPERRLVSNPPVAGARFGHALALDGGTLIVGAPGENSAYSFRGLGAVAAKPVVEEPGPTDVYLALAAVEDDAFAGYAIPRSLRGPFRAELTAGALGEKRSAAHDGALFAVGVEIVGSEPRALHEVRARFVSGGLEVDALAGNTTVGTPVTLAGEEIVDFAIEQVGADLVYSVRRTGDGPFTEVGRTTLADPTLVFRPFMRVEGVDEGAEIGFDEPVLTEGADPAAVPPGERTQNLIYEAMLLQLDAEAALTEDDPETPPEDSLTMAGEKLDEAAALLKATPAKSPRKLAKKEAKRLEKARKQLQKAIKKILKGKSTRSIEKKIGKAYSLESKTLSKLTPQ